MQALPIELNPLISFVIPTYNFGKYIEQTIRSINDGVNTLKLKEFEIVVLDGGSKDDTTIIIENLAQEYGNIRYQKNLQRGGIDADLNDAVELAVGKYIWLFSADDILINAWDVSLIPLLEKNNDVYLIPAKLCDINMKELRKNPIFSTKEYNKSKSYNFTGQDSEIKNYLEDALTLEALFSFMSSILIKRKIWYKLEKQEKYFGSCWAHSVRIIPIIYQNSNITYINQYLIYKRSGNDSFMEHGLVHRISIAVDGWGMIIEEFFKDKYIKQVLYKLLQKDISIILFIYAKISADKNEMNELNRMYNLLFNNWLEEDANTKWHWIYKLIPNSLLITKLIKPVLPFLVKLRHNLRDLKKPISK